MYRYEIKTKSKIRKRTAVNVLWNRSVNVMNRCKDCDNILVPESHMSTLFSEDFMKTYCTSCIQKQIDMLIRIQKTVIER